MVAHRRLGIRDAGALIHPFDFDAAAFPTLDLSQLDLAAVGVLQDVVRQLGDRGGDHAARCLGEAHL